MFVFLLGVFDMETSVFFKLCYAPILTKIVSLIIETCVMFKPNSR